MCQKNASIAYLCHKYFSMTSQFIIGIVITGYLLVVGGLFAIEFIKARRGGDSGHH